MPLTHSQRLNLFDALQTRGWQWREEFIYAPHGTMWLLGSEPWVDDLSEFHERMSGRLQRNLKADWMYEDEREHNALVEDTKSLVEVLAEMLSATDAALS